MHFVLLYAILNLHVILGLFLCRIVLWFFAQLVGQICADLGPDCSLFVKSTKFSGMTELIMTINI